MDRREALKYTALALGYSLSAGTITAVLQGCSGSDDPSWRPTALNAKQALLVSEIAETMIPRTDTPGAKDVFADRFVDEMLGKWANLETKIHFNKGLEAFDHRCKKDMGKPFVKCKPEKRLEFLNTVNAEVVKYMKELKQQPPGTEPGEFEDFFMTLKQLIFTGYFTNKEICTKYLAYDPIPGRYEGCVPVSVSNGRAWAL